MKFEVTGDIEALCKAFFFLAYNACGSEAGMGIFQRRESVTPDEIWNNVKGNGDYPGGPRHDAKARPYGDYVFGRMMKTGLDIEGNIITVSDLAPRVSYQAWVGKYPTYEALLKAAAVEAGVEVKAVQTEEATV